jgi:hypothetical protein
MAASRNDRRCAAKPRKRYLKKAARAALHGIPRPAVPSLRQDLETLLKAQEALREIDQLMIARAQESPAP